MKRMLLISTLLIIAVSLSFSQMAYKKGDQVISLGIGLGGFAGAYGGTSGIAFSGGYENAVHENVSIGGLVGYSSSSDEYNYYGGSYGWKYTYILIGVRGAYHIDLIKDPKIDTYGGIILGYNIVSATETGSRISGYGSYSASASYMLFGAFIGGRYYFSPKLAAQVELGYGVGILNVGIAYKL